MDIHIIKETELPLLARKKVTIKAGFTESKTPTKGEMLKAVAEKLKVAPELIRLEKIDQSYGSATATVDVYVYKDAESFKKFAPKVKKAKKAKEAK